MADNGLVMLATQKPVLFIKLQTSKREPNQLGLTKQEILKVTLECPRCCWIFEAKKPDNQHPNFTYNKQDAYNAKGSIIEEPRVCRNPKCKKQFTIYWHKTATKRQNA